MLNGKRKIIYLKVCLTVSYEYFANKWQNKRPVLSFQRSTPLFFFLTSRNTFGQPGSGDAAQGLLTRPAWRRFGYWCSKVVQEVEEAGGPGGGAQPLNWQMSFLRPGLKGSGSWQMPISALHLPAFVHHWRNPNTGAHTFDLWQ